MSSQPDYAAPGASAPGIDGPGDAELISAVRAGDIEAYGTLFARHADAARRLARQLVSAGDVDDLVSEAFSKVLGVLQRGGGPDLAFRAYLLTSLRRLHVDKLRASSRLTTTDDLTPYDPGVPFNDTVVSGFENATAAKAFASLPERWQQVLWHTEVEGQKPADIAPLLGMSANSVSALAYRAREGLRQAFVTMHANDAAEDVCANVRGELGAYIRGGTSRRTSVKIEEHLGECRECTAIYLELTEVNSHLGAILAPALLGTAGAGYLAAAHGIAAKGVLVGLGHWLIHTPAGKATSVTGGVAAAGVAVAVAVAATSGSPAPVVAGPKPPITSAPAPTTPAVTPPVVTPSPTPKPHVPPARVTVPPSVAPTPPATPPPTGPQIVQPPAPVTAPPSGSVTLNLFLGIKDPADGLHIVKVTAAHGTVSIPALRASLVFARTAPGTVIYTAKPGWKGTDTVRYTIGDTNGLTVTGSVNVTTLDAAPIAPAVSTAAPASWTLPVPTTIPLLAGATDPNGDVLTLVPTSGTTTHGGTFSISGGSAVYRPAAGYGSVPGSPVTDSFTYTVSDGTLRTTGDVQVTLGVLAAPQAHDDAVSLTSSSPVLISVLANDSDPSGATPVVLTQGSHGAATVVGDQIRYAPSGSPQADSFTYSITDAKGQSSTATVTISVPLPVAQPTLMVDTHDYGTYQHLRVKLHGLAAGLTSTVSITLTGFDAWAPALSDESVCGSAAGAAPGTVVLTCSYTSTGPGDQQLLHFDFIPSGPWSYAVSVAGTNYQGDASVSGP
ncbi:hypothetical protein Back2_06930 [Nocardioides baekrokdamisoli]|uniref:RNA polymerase sigma-70 region 2 domain-containing protein n=1 Tax=Nocardioides baekrokdamisoli TaxID=1804624 RepID=A0A3G9IDH0_9ACTN|nr:sigma-70 family RNA polymerase sigma factor [Nocardioides baekrokdamisoli]BBH16406.1 hypothetical protein Back2_06930 [Nocardioides baekrokdamisoli]